MADLQPMVVSMYTRSRGYGFCAASSEDAQVYFHADVFHRTMPQEPPPIVGEAVQVEVSSNSHRPKAIRVLRAAPPSRLALVLPTPRFLHPAQRFRSSRVPFDSMYESGDESEEDQEEEEFLDPQDHIEYEPREDFGFFGEMGLWD